MAMDLYYDGGGGRTKKVVAQGSTTYYFGEHYEVKDGVVTKYIFAGNTRVAQIADDDTNYYHKDHLGSSSVMTDDQGTVVESTDYLPFGEMRSHTGTEVSNYKFTDQELDPESGLYNYDARMYDPVVGLFVTADIMVQNFPNPQTLNRYSYCHNNPLYYIDPSGHIAWAAIGIFIAHVAAGAAIGAAIGSAFAAITGQDIGQGALTGAITGAFFGGAGGTIDVASISSVTQKVALHAIAGAAGGAVSASATNGNVGMAALTGGISGGVAKFTGGFMEKWKWNWGEQLAGRSLVGGITGGVAAEMYGGKFMDGFVMGAESAAFGMLCNETGAVVYEGVKQMLGQPPSKPDPVRLTTSGSVGGISVTKEIASDGCTPETSLTVSGQVPLLSSIGFSLLEYRQNPPALNERYCSPYIGWRNLGIGTNIVWDAGEGLNSWRIQGLNIYLGFSIGVPFGAEVPWR